MPGNSLIRNRLPRTIPHLGYPFGVISDIHSNWRNFKSCLIRLKKLGARNIVCLGDIVGYGDEPGECLKAAHDHLAPTLTILGNHDVALCRLILGMEFKVETMTDNALTILEEQSRKLTSSEINTLLLLYKNNVFSLSNKRFNFAHAIPAKLEGFSEWCYLTADRRRLAWDREKAANEEGHDRIFYEAGEVLPHVQQSINFVGHTHAPQAYRMGKKMIVNVGSVGRPRTGVPSCILVRERKLATIRV